MKKMLSVCLAVFLLAGFFSCGREELEPTSAATITQATTTEFIPGSFRHPVAKRIHEGLPEFTFILIGEADVDDTYPDYVLATAVITAIDIAGEDFRQRLDGFETEFVLPQEGTDDYGLAFDDFNNDGFLDLRLHFFTTTREGASLFWLWDSDQKQFIRNEQLEELSDFTRHFAREEDGPRMYRFLKGSTEDGTAATYNDYYYEYIDGGFVLVEHEIMWYEYDDDDVGYENIETYKLVDGVMVLDSKTREEE